MKRLKCFIRPSMNYSSPIRYVLKMIECRSKVDFSFTDNADDADVVYDDRREDSQPLSIKFYDALSYDSTELVQEKIFSKTTEVLNARGDEDLLASIFYMVNCLQEVDPEANNTDKIGRFLYSASYQKRFSCITDNVVESKIVEFCNRHNILLDKKPSEFFISHDIDLLYGSILQDGFWAIKRMNIGVICQLLMNELLRRPHWRNIDKILKINSEYDIRTCFFWLVKKGVGLDGVKNSDYRITKETDLLDMVNAGSSINGLHKASSLSSFDEELNAANLGPYNRFHFLKFQTVKDWPRLSSSKIELDASLGFAEQYGFRNSYGKPFQPFDLDSKRPFDFVIAPLTFMDATLHHYMKLPKDSFGDHIIDFFEANRFDITVSLLWHNTYFTNYKYSGFLKEYKKVLAYIYESKVRVVTPAEIISENRMTW